ncbi:MAG: RrF2 family transcriptional regulator [Thermodesulfobacteriota bacterium]
MRLSTKSLYGVRAVFDIAYNSKDLPVQVRDISKRQRISPRYLEQIFQKLKRAGILNSKRGPKGGYYLAKDISKITVGDILRATEGPPDLVFCVAPKRPGKCNLLDQCVTRPIWEETGRRIAEYLDSISIDDLCRRGKRMGIEQDGW